MVGLSLFGCEVNILYNVRIVHWYQPQAWWDPRAQISKSCGRQRGIVVMGLLQDITHIPNCPTPHPGLVLRLQHRVCFTTPVEGKSQLTTSNNITPCLAFAQLGTSVGTGDYTNGVTPLVVGTPPSTTSVYHWCEIVPSPNTTRPHNTMLVAALYQIPPNTK